MIRSTANQTRRWPRWGVALLLLLGLATAVAMAVMLMRPAAGVPADLDYSKTRLSDAGLFQVTFTPSVEPIPINQLQSWTLHLATAAGQPVLDAEIAVDGDMPQHGHGLPTRPQVTQDLGGGNYLVEGLKFQMGGWWVMEFDITAAGQTDHVSFNLQLD